MRVRCGGEAVQTTLGERPIFESRAPTKSKDEMMIVGRGQTILDGRLDVALDTFLYGTGIYRRRKTQKKQGQPNECPGMHH